MSTRTSPPALTLRGRWLLPAHVAWVAVAITALEIIVVAVQAYVFTLLTAVFIGMAIHAHH